MLELGMRGYDHRPLRVGDSRSPIPSLRHPHVPGVIASFARTAIAPIAVAISVIAVMLAAPSFTSAQAKPGDNSTTAQVTKAVGTIKNVQRDSITVAAESGGEVTAKLTDSTKILRVPPGEKDLKNAVALKLEDLQPGDRVLVRGQKLPDGQTITALAVIVMKQTDVAAKQQQERDDWQKRGVGGLVTKVDPATDTITISASTLGASKSIAIHVAKNTILRRYAPGSVKFDDAKPEPPSDFMSQTKAGDQLRARGTRSGDGSELAAEEIVAGSFRNIAGTIKAIDAANNTITVQDAISKSAVAVKISGDSQMKKLAPEMAQRIASRLKATAGAGQDQGQGQAQAPADAPGQIKSQASGQGAASNPGRARYGADSHAHTSAGGPGAGSGNGSGGNGPPDLQRMLSRLPNSTLSDLQKGDAVMIVATEGAASDAATAITLLAGVDPILTASPNRSASSLLSPWSLSAPGGEAEGAQQ